MSPATRFSLALAATLLTGVLFPFLHYAFAREAGSASALGACVWLALMVSGWLHSLGREKGRLPALAVLLLPMPAVLLAEAPFAVMLQSAGALFVARRLLQPAAKGLLPWLGETALTMGGGALCLWLAPDVIPAPLSRSVLAWSAATCLFMLLQSVLLLPLSASDERSGRLVDPFEHHRRRAERLLE